MAILGNLRFLAAAAALSLLAPGNPARLDAALLVDEPFAYALNEGANMNGVRSNGVGLTGPYRTKLTTTGEDLGQTGSTVYTPAGLSFGPKFHPTSGGAIILSAKAGGANGTSAKETLTVSLTPAATGTVYLSYLVRYAAPLTESNSYSSASASAGDLRTHTRMRNEEDPYHNYIGVGMGSSAPGVEFTLEGEVTYLVLARYINVGLDLAANPGTATLWLLDQAAYEAWHEAGAAEDDLDRHALAQAAQAVTAGAFKLDGFLSIVIGTGGKPNFEITGIYDEWRVGTTLAEVTSGVAPTPK